MGMLTEPITNGNLEEQRAQVRARTQAELGRHFAGPTLGYAQAMAAYLTFGLPCPPAPETFDIGPEQAVGLTRFVELRLAEAVSRGA